MKIEGYSLLALQFLEIKLFPKQTAVRISIFLNAFVDYYYMNETNLQRPDERAMGIGPTAFSLGRRHSTSELRPQKHSKTTEIITN